MTKLVYSDINSVLAQISWLEKENHSIKRGYFSVIKLDCAVYKELKGSSCEYMAKEDVLKAVNAKSECVEKIKSNNMEIQKLYRLLKHNYQMHMIWDI